MADAAAMDRWDIAASHMALQINMRSKKGARVVEPNELNPYRANPGKKQNCGIGVLKMLLPKDAQKKHGITD